MPKKSLSGNEIPLWGIFLFFLGTVFLLQTLGLIPWGLWGNLWRFWPVLIIIAGLYILLRHSHVWIATGIILVLLFGCLGIALWQYGPEPAPGQSYSQPVAGISRARVAIDFAAGRFDLNALPAASANLVEAVPLNRAGIRGEFTKTGTEGNLALSRQRGPDLQAEARWEIRLTRNVPLSLNISSSAAQGNYQLADLNVSDFHLKANVGNYDLRLPSSGTKGTVEANLANVEIIIPEGVVASIRADANLGAIEVDEGRFPRKGGSYVSADFDTGRNKVELDLECNIGRIRVR